MVATRKVTLRDFVIFQVKLGLEGLASILIIQLSVLAMVADLFSGKAAGPRFFYSVVRMSERFDAWLNLYGAVKRLEAGESDDGFFGASEAGADSLLGKLEEIVRGGDEPRQRRPRN